MFCFVFRCLGISSSLAPRMGVMGGKKLLQRKKEYKLVSQGKPKLLEFIRAFLHLQRVEKYLSVSVLCFFLTYLLKHRPPLFSIMCSMMSVPQRTMKMKTRSLHSQWQACSQSWMMYDLICIFYKVCRLYYAGTASPWSGSGLCFLILCHAM